MEVEGLLKGRTMASRGLSRGAPGARDGGSAHPREQLPPRAHRAGRHESSFLPGPIGPPVVHWGQRHHAESSCRRTGSIKGEIRLPTDEATLSTRRRQPRATRKATAEPVAGKATVDRKARAKAKAEARVARAKARMADARVARPRASGGVADLFALRTHSFGCFGAH